MAEDHRRVEPRGIVGTGMATDPERIQALADEGERKKRAWVNAPERGFADVLAEAPAEGVLADEDEAPKRDPKRPESAPASTAMAAAALAPGAPAAKAVIAQAKPPEKALPRVAKDPREEILRRKLEQLKRAPAPIGPTDTPPTGSRKRKPT